MYIKYENDELYKVITYLTNIGEKVIIPLNTPEVGLFYKNCIDNSWHYSINPSVSAVNINELCSKDKLKEMVEDGFAEVKKLNKIIAELKDKNLSLRKELYHTRDELLKLKDKSREFIHKPEKKRYIAYIESLHSQLEQMKKTISSYEEYENEQSRIISNTFILA